MKMYKIYIIAGEASGDLYGANLIKILRNKSPHPIEFHGIGGDKMAAVGFKSLFEMSELSIMGFVEIIPQIKKMLKRIDKTATNIRLVRPDIIITIDSPGFCCRVVKKLQGKESLVEKLLTKILVKPKQKYNKARFFKPFKAPYLHYVAPTVWAYKPERAKTFANLFDHLLAILPFEPPHFESEGLPCTFVGHPITEIKFPEDSASFRQKYNIAEDDTLICIMPGSRMNEVKRLLPIFLKTITLLTAQTNIKVAIPTIGSIKDYVQKVVDSSPVQTIIIDNDHDKLACYKSANAAIVKSGTGTLEVAMAGCPMVVGYKVNYFSYRIIKSMIKVRFVNLVNIILDDEVVPEFIQQYCTPYLISQQLDKILRDEKIRAYQILRCQQVLKYIGLSLPNPPSENATEQVLKLIEQNDD